MCSLIGLMYKSSIRENIRFHVCNIFECPMPKKEEEEKCLIMSSWVNRVLLCNTFTQQHYLMVSKIFQLFFHLRNVAYIQILSWILIFLMLQRMQQGLQVTFDVKKSTKIKNLDEATKKRIKGKYSPK